MSFALVTLPREYRLVAISGFAAGETGPQALGLPGGALRGLSLVEGSGQPRLRRPLRPAKTCPAAMRTHGLSKPSRPREAVGARGPVLLGQATLARVA